MKKTLRHAAFICTLALAILIEPALAVQISGSLQVETSADLAGPHYVQTSTGLDLRLSEARGYTDAQVTLKLGSPSSSPQVSEAALTWYGTSSEISVGRQVLNWGTALKLNPADVVNPIDLSTSELSKRPVTTVAATFFWPQGLEVTGVWIPEFVPSTSVFPGNPGIPVVLPERTLANSEGAARAIYRGNGYDLSLIGFTGWDDVPSIEPTPNGPRGIFRPVNTFGAGLSTSVGEVALWGEGRYSLYSNGTAVEGIVGGDYRTASGYYLMAQYHHLNQPTNQANHILGVLEKGISLTQTARIGFFANADDGSFVLRPESEISLADGMKLNLSGAYSSGNVQSLGAFATSNHVKARFTVSF